MVNNKLYVLSLITLGLCSTITDAAKRKTDKQSNTTLSKERALGLPEQKISLKKRKRVLRSVVNDEMITLTLVNELDELVNYSFTGIQPTTKKRRESYTKNGRMYTAHKQHGTLYTSEGTINSHQTTQVSIPKNIVQSRFIMPLRLTVKAKNFDMLKELVKVGTSRTFIFQPITVKKINIVAQE